MEPLFQFQGLAVALCILGALLLHVSIRSFAQKDRRSDGSECESDQKGRRKARSKGPSPQTLRTLSKLYRLPKGPHSIPNSYRKYLPPLRKHHFMEAERLWRHLDACEPHEMGPVLHEMALWYYYQYWNYTAMILWFLAFNHGHEEAARWSRNVFSGKAFWLEDQMADPMDPLASMYESGKFDHIFNLATPLHNPEEARRISAAIKHVPGHGPYFLVKEEGLL